MYTNILILSDNLYLCHQFELLIKNLKYANVKWTFAISPFSNHIEFSEQIKKDVLVYNLKDKNSIDQIIGSYDLIFSVHCKQLFPNELLQKIKCINIHPGYNPINRGWYPQVFAIINNLLIGATIHEIDNELDHGRIIARAFVAKEITDTSESLYNKVIHKEIDLISENIEAIIKNKYDTFEPENEGNLYMKKDFRNICEIDLN